MTNIEIKGKVENKDTKKLEDVTYALGGEIIPESIRKIKEGNFSDFIYSNKNFYINLDTVSRFEIKRFPKSFYIEKSDELTNSFEKILIKEGTHYIIFYKEGILNDEESYYSGPMIMEVLIFPKESEFQRFNRILTEKLCVK